MNPLNDDKITLFESGIGDGNDLLLGFPSYEQLLRDGQEIFDIIHRNKGFDSSKIITYYPLNNFLYMIKAEYKVKKLSEFGLIDFRVDMLKPHNYKFKLTAEVDDSGDIYKKEWICEGTIDRDEQYYTIVEFDEEEFLPENSSGVKYSGTLPIEYQIENILGDSIITVCFDDETISSTGFQFIKAKTMDYTYFMSQILEELNFVASPATEYINFQRRQLNIHIFKQWLYPYIQSLLSVDYLCVEKIHGVLLEYGVEAIKASGMDFPYKYSLTFTNPYIGDKVYESEKFYNNLDAGAIEIVENVGLAQYEKVIYDPNIHGQNDIKDFIINTNIPPSIMILDPEFINKDIQFFTINPINNEINLNNIKTMNTYGITRFSSLTEKQIVFEYIYNNQLFRIFKKYDIRSGDLLFTCDCTLIYEILDLATMNCISSLVIDLSDEDKKLNEQNSRLTNDYVIETRNIFVTDEKIYIIAERMVEYIHKFDKADIDNTPYIYEIIQVCINLFSGGYSKDTIITKDYSVDISNYEQLVTTQWTNDGKSKFIIIPSCRADIFYDSINNDYRVDVLFKQIQAHKGTYDANAIGGGSFPEQFCLYYCCKGYSPTLIYSSTNVPLTLDFGDTVGVCSSKDYVTLYYKTIQRSNLVDLGYVGVEINLTTNDVINIDFQFTGLMKILNIRDQYLIIKQDVNNISCAKMKVGLNNDIVLNHGLLSNNNYTYLVNKDIIYDTIFNNRDGIINEYMNIGEFVLSTDFRYLNRNLILKDRFHTKYIDKNTGFISTKSKGDMLDFILNYNKTQMEIDQDKIIWFGTVNDIDIGGDVVTYATRYEFMTTGFDSLLTDKAIYFNLFTLMVTPLFDLYYKELSTGINRTLTGEFFKTDTDIIYESFVYNGMAFMYNCKEDKYIWFESDMLPSDRQEYITELTWAEYIITLPENGFLITTDILQKQCMIFWEKSTTVSVRLLDDIDKSKTRKKIPVEQRVKMIQYKMTFYNFLGIISQINVRYATKMPYDIGDIIPFVLIASNVDFCGTNITLNKTFAKLSGSVLAFQGARIYQIVANKIKDMEYKFKLEEQIVYFTTGLPKDHISSLLLPLLSINGTEYNRFVENNYYTLLYMRDYVDAENYEPINPYYFMDNIFYFTNEAPYKDYLLDFTGHMDLDIEVSKRDVFDRYFDGRDFDRPKYKNFELPFVPTNFLFVCVSSNPDVKIKIDNFYIYHYTNYEEIGEEKPKVLEATKLGGHTNTYVYWQDNPADIAKNTNAYVRTTTDEILCIEAVEEEIIVDGQVYTKWFHSSVNGLDDNGNIVDSVMLADPDFITTLLKKQGKADSEIRLITTNIQDLLPEETVTKPTFSVITNNSKVDYEFKVAASDVGLTNKETREIDATINFFSNHNTKINVGEEAYSIEKNIKGCIVTNSESKKEFIVDIDNPLYSSFYYSSTNVLATTIDMFMPYIIPTSENIILSIDYVKTLTNIDINANYLDKTDEDLWLMILGLSTGTTISLFVTAEIVFPEQVSWNPDLQLGTYYLNNQEFVLLPNVQNNIYITSSDIITFSTTPLPDEFSPIVLINEETGKEYQRVYFKNNDNMIVLTKEEEIIFDDCWHGVLSNINVDIDTITLSESKKIASLDGTILTLSEPIEPDKIVKVSYQLINSFCVNIDSDKNKVNFTVHSIDEKAKFKVNYTQDSSIQADINANPLTSINRGFVQLGGN